ncbi:hypothetical protein IFT84_02325 [Rhizobium sp. CFBP 8762]|uniref:hypothetical protein n=1 Tax=Rhizobium sp. CFBP 8762 TaxID=2775279 RepID=UPI0017848C22|nr:hypothetical protein [Rhizobium sp. CFBP 8762]MBD8553355.1 hypothetical protein [Rhizobium sp. CFBP 8762]
MRIFSIITMLVSSLFLGFLPVMAATEHTSRMISMHEQHGEGMPHCASNCDAKPAHTMHPMLCSACFAVLAETILSSRPAHEPETLTAATEPAFVSHINAPPSPPPKS